MKIKIDAIANAKDIVGNIEELEFQEKQIKIQDILGRIGVPLGYPVVLTVNGKMTNEDTIIIDNDKVVIVPIIGGG
ncbi:MAG TPA: MoaD/ThiS family protein [Anaerovoracaceae bacterium]|nr:MoaD/ThiS family protein [Anaerovoracaceae bacterium]